ncbi:hypothetical protein B0H13DRAFT_2663312 [Mycena leptocephala]|nr:hypothetical protein B0H13DRAFT_2663312 [Mycena leptocephala]
MCRPCVHARHIRSMCRLWAECAGASNRLSVALFALLDPLPIPRFATSCLSSLFVCLASLCSVLPVCSIVTVPI